MSFHHFLRLAGLLAALTGLLFARSPFQLQTETRVPSVGAAGKFTPAAEPAVPADPLELVTGGAQPIENAEQRAAVLNLPLSRLHALEYPAVSVLPQDEFYGVRFNQIGWKLAARRHVDWRDCLSVDGSGTGLFGD